MPKVVIHTSVVVVLRRNGAEPVDAKLKVPFWVFGSGSKFEECLRFLAQAGLGIILPTMPTFRGSLSTIGAFVRASTRPLKIAIALRRCRDDAITYGRTLQQPPGLPVEEEERRSLPE